MKVMIELIHFIRGLHMYKLHVYYIAVQKSTMYRAWEEGTRMYVHVYLY